MSDFKQILRDEIADFRQAGHKFYNKELTVDEFKSKSGGMGVYAQRGGEKFMIRLRIPAGVLSLNKLKIISNYAEKYNLDFIHLTTRQAIQLHNLSIDDVCDIMEDSLENDIYTRGGGGNFPRNVALSPLSGVEIGEAFDTTPYALLVNEHFMSNIYNYKLPRKLKVGFSNSSTDEANTTLTDLGFLATTKDNKPYFKLYLGGGLGKNPAVGISFDELVNPKDVLYHVEAMTQLFIAEGDYQNKNKARTRYIVSRMGEEAFLSCYKKHLAQVKADMKLKSIESAPVEIKTSATADGIEESNCVKAQKQAGLYTVIIQPLCGQLDTKGLKQILAVLETCQNSEIRLSMTESMYIRNLTQSQVQSLLNITKDIRQKTKIEQSVSCIGVPICQMGIEQSQKILKHILSYLEDKNLTEDILPSIHISGCPNSCSRHQVSQIGFSGKKKKVNDVLEDVFELHIGGEFSEQKTNLGKVYKDMLAKDIPVFLYELACILKQNQLDFITYFKDKEQNLNSLVEKYLV